VCRACSVLELRIGKRTNDGGRIEKGTHAVRRFAFAFEDVRNALQSCDGVVAARQLRWAVRIDPYILRLQSTGTATPSTARTRCALTRFLR